jgi:uncharacterized protein
MRLPGLFIAQTEKKGKGVFTHEKIEANTIIEMAPVLVMTAEERKLLDQTLLHDYIFEWGGEKNQCGMALGWIAVYNHSYESNSEYFMDFDEATMFVKTVRVIEAGEEITINYNGNWNDAKKVWFDVK